MLSVPRRNCEAIGFQRRRDLVSVIEHHLIERPAALLSAVVEQRFEALEGQILMRVSCYAVSLTWLINSAPLMPGRMRTQSTSALTK